MPLDDNDKKVIAEIFNQQFTPLIGQHITPIAEGLKKLNDDIPGYAGRAAADYLKKNAPAAAAAPAGKKTEGSDDVEALRAELAASQQKITVLTQSHETLVGSLNQRDTETMVRKATSTIEWMDPEEPVGELMKLVKKDADGSLYVPTKVKIAGSTATNDIKVPLEDAVKSLAERKPHWKKASLAGGTGAGGANNSTRDYSSKPSWDQLMSDPKLLLDWQTHNPEYVQQLGDTAAAEMRKKSRGG